MRTLIEIIQDACQEGDGITFHLDYVGRGMSLPTHDRSCIGISGNQQALEETLGLVYGMILKGVYEAALYRTEEEASKCHDLGQEYISRLSNRYWDNLGQNTIYYWPQIPGDFQS